MRATKKRTSPFIAVLPIMVLAACPQSVFRTSNPPDPTTTPKPLEPATKMTNPPEPTTKAASSELTLEAALKPVHVNPPPLDPKVIAPKLPTIDPGLPPIKPVNVNPPPLDPELVAPKLPAAFSKREKRADGTCYVQIFANPPYERGVSCIAPIEPAIGGETWCKVEDAKDPSKKVSVDCASK